MRALCMRRAAPRGYRALQRSTVVGTFYTPTCAFSSIFSHVPFTATPVERAEASSTPGSRVNDSPVPLAESQPTTTTGGASPTARAPRASRDDRAHRGKKHGKEEEEYAFPIGRALRYIRVGQHVRRQEVFFTEEMDTLLQASRECVSERRQAAARVGRERRRPCGVALYEDGEGGEDGGVEMFVHAWTTRHDHSSSNHASENEADTAADDNHPVVETLSDEERGKVERFLKYHMHHVIVSYKQKRKALQAHGRAAADAGSPAAVRVVTDYILYASLLLHLSALFGFSGSSDNQPQMIEKLLQTVFSCSIFLSQYLRRSRARGRRPSQRRGFAAPRVDHREDSFGGFFQLLTPACTNSLHWGVIHFCEGVRLWELQSHQYALQPMVLRPSAGGGGGRSVTAGREGAAGRASSPTSSKALAPPRDPYHVLLQTHARLVLSLMPQDASPPSLSKRQKTMKKARRVAPAAAFRMPPALQDALVLLAGSDSIQEKSHAILKWMGEYTDDEVADNPVGAKQVVKYDVGDAIEAPQGMRIQSRRLQLLPLFWTALVCHGVRHRPSADPYAREGSSSLVRDMRTARHALRAIIPLFHEPGTQDSEATTVEPSFFYLLTFLYTYPFGDDGGASVASATELLALLAMLETHRVVRPQMWQTQHILSERERHKRRGEDGRPVDEVAFADSEVAPRHPIAFARHNFMLFFENWFRQHERSAMKWEETASDLVRLKGKKELYLSLSHVPFTLLVVPSLTALETAAGRRPPPSPMWQTLKRELPRLYAATLLRHLAQWPVTVPPAASEVVAAGDGRSTHQQEQREMVSFVEELELTLKAVLRVVHFIHYKEGEAAEREGGAPEGHQTFDCLLERQLLRLVTFQLGCEVYPRRLHHVRLSEKRDPVASISTREKELMLAIHRCLMSVFVRTDTHRSGALPRVASAGQEGNLHPEYVQHLHALLKA